MRLWLAASGLAGLAVAAALIAVLALSRTQSHANEAMAAQRRIEAYSALAIRTTEWTLGWLIADQHPDPTPVREALATLDQLIVQDAKSAPTEAEAVRRARQSMTVAKLRGAFNQLDRALAESLPDSPAGNAAITFYNAQTPALAAMQVEHETRRRDLALQEMEGLRRPLLAAAIGIAVMAALLLAGLYILTLRPLFARLRLTTLSAESMITALPPRASAGHDELGLMFARLRQMAARIDRRRARLENTIAERTAELSGANQRLSLIDSTRRRFFADVGHELRTPLTVILGEAELGAARPDLDPEQRAAFETIRTRALRLFRRIEDLLRIARSESGQLELDLGEVDLRQAILTAQQDLAPLLRRAAISTQIDIPAGLTVTGDRDWLRQVFAGLFENSAKYAGQGAEILVSAQVRDDRARIEFSDNGPGLPDHARDLVFGRFIQGDDAQAGGFGVGLALARWVMEASGGSLCALPSDRGLRLGLDLPLSDRRESTWPVS